MINYKKALDLLINFAMAEGYEVILDHTLVSRIEWVENSLNTPSCIRVERKFKPEIKVYLLLHELGHHLLRKDWKEFTTIFPIAAYAEEIYLEKDINKYKRRLSYTVSSIEEEFKAWDEGLNLANSLGIKLNHKNWHNFKVKCLTTYIKSFCD